MFPRNVKDRIAIGDDCYSFENLPGGRVRLVPAPDEVVEPGTEINKQYLQPIEDALGAINYEKGVWTPELGVFLSSPGEIEYTYQEGHYECFGEQVILDFKIKALIKAVNRASRPLTLEGLPFSVKPFINTTIPTFFFPTSTAYVSPGTTEGVWAFTFTWDSTKIQLCLSGELVTWDNLIFPAGDFNLTISGRLIYRKE